MNRSQNSSFPMRGWNEYRANGNGGRFELLVAESFIALNALIKRNTENIELLVGGHDLLVKSHELLAKRQEKIIDIVERNSKNINILIKMMGNHESRISELERKSS